MPEAPEHGFIRQGLNRLMQMKVINSWTFQSSEKGTRWEIKINDKVTLTKSTGSAKAFIHGAMAATAAKIDHRAAVSVVSDGALKLEAKKRGWKVLDGD